MSVWRALVRPDLGFQDTVKPAAIPLLLLALFLTYCAGERLVAGYYQNPYMSSLAVLEVQSRIDAVMFGAPPEARERAKDQMLGSLLGASSRLFRSVSIVASSAVFLLLVLEAWLIHAVLSQFFGAQEERLATGTRPSQLLFLVAFLPLSFRKLVEGLLMALKDPATAANALTLAEYRRLSRVSFSLLDRLTLNGLPAVPMYLLRSLTDPFFLWTLLILILGGREVYRVTLRSSAVMGLFIVALIALQAALLQSIGIQWGI